MIRIGGESGANGLVLLENIDDDPGIDSGFRQDAADTETAAARSNRWLAFLVFLTIEGMLFAFFIFTFSFLNHIQFFASLTLFVYAPVLGGQACFCVNS